jgi:hypothetical protein
MAGHGSQKVVFLHKYGTPDKLLILDSSLYNSENNTKGLVLIDLESGAIDSAGMTSLFGDGLAGQLNASYNEVQGKLYLYGPFSSFSGKKRNGLVKLDY